MAIRGRTPKYTNEDITNIHTAYKTSNVSLQKYCTDNNLNYYCVVNGFRRLKLVKSRAKILGNKVPYDPNFGTVTNG